MRDLRLGDVLDDFCIKCRRLTNHSIVSLLSGKAAKVRCRTCYNDHDFRNEIAPPSKKDLKKAALFNQVLASAGVPAAPGPSPLPGLSPVAEPPLMVDPPVLADPPVPEAALDASPLLDAAPAADSKPAPKKARKKA
jgi:hypothetical protein